MSILRMFRRKSESDVFAPRIYFFLPASANATPMMRINCSIDVKHHIVLRWSTIRNKLHRNEGRRGQDRHKNRRLPVYKEQRHKHEKEVEED